ncbi:fatty acyl-AMP ligase [Kutzneria viridogrisea]|uniref:AMP-dependent synthetase/ligase domain-containing protein n=2 Tax=Kutzneria TaxID=43356 RepID=W5WGG0_9PSEU|nr:AMP-binding protein [Kutzneria albida]AHH99661.1 hypothetical protein KALB_6301 [Kutzneria albida DSM 43870]MBA8924837.1 acyl-CoA synthetase (AMP-forming)/AMP-acid ligase II [Kutzneria viridogrisea]
MLEPLAGRQDRGDPLTDYLERWAAEKPDRPALTFSGAELDSVTWAELAVWVRETAAHLARTVASGQRVAIVCPQGLDYVVAFLATVRAGLVAVPLYAPDQVDEPGRLGLVLADCRADCVLTTSGALPGLFTFLADFPQASPQAVIAVDLLRGQSQTSMPPERSRRDDIACLRYAFDSARNPAGVVLTVANLVANARQLLAAVRHRARHTVGMLPLYDESALLLNIVVPMVGGLHGVLIDPELAGWQPARWLEALAEYPRAITAAPPTVLASCVRHAADMDQHALRLDRVTALFMLGQNRLGEIVPTVEQVLGRWGLRQGACLAWYGVAEATAFVAIGSTAPGGTVVGFDRDLLAEGIAVQSTSRLGRNVDLVGYELARGLRAVVVDPASHRRLADNQVGEVWLAGPSVARGYWSDADRTIDRFPAFTQGEDVLSIVEGPWLRTGDLGVLREGRLHVVGAMNDLVDLRGQSHFLSDVEATVADGLPAVRPEAVTAFPIPAVNVRGLIVVVESVAEPDPVVQAVRAALACEHGIGPREVVVVPPWTLPRTARGAVDRSACSRRYMLGEW